MTMKNSCFLDRVVMLDYTLSAHDKVVYASLCAFAPTGDIKCSPSVNEIAEMASCSRRKIFQCLNTLEEKGYILRERQGRDVTLYKLILRRQYYDGMVSDE